jgi:hypothetical protein
MEGKRNLKESGTLPLPPHAMHCSIPEVQGRFIIGPRASPHPPQCGHFFMRLRLHQVSRHNNALLTSRRLGSGQREEQPFHNSTSRCPVRSTRSRLRRLCVNSKPTSHVKRNRIRPRGARSPSATPSYATTGQRSKQEPTRHLPRGRGTAQESVRTPTQDQGRDNQSRQDAGRPDGGT